MLKKSVLVKITGIIIIICFAIAVSISAEEKKVSGEKKTAEEKKITEEKKAVEEKKAGESKYQSEAKTVPPPKPSSDEALAMLKVGNMRFITGKAEHPNTDSSRVILASKQNQKDYAYATIISCSDSRVPVEYIFDAGIMDLFIIRVAGNVCDTDEIGSIEYGLAHVNTPLLVVLGHTQCGAVTAVTNAIQGKGHELERNIPPLVDNIQPAVKRAMALKPEVKDDTIIPYCIEENVWQGIEDIFTKSPAIRNLVKTGKVKVVGAIYDLESGRVDWLSSTKPLELLKQAESNPKKETEAMAAGGHGIEHGSGHSADKAAEHTSESAKHDEQVEIKEIDLNASESPAKEEKAPVKKTTKQPVQKKGH